MKIVKDKKFSSSLDNILDYIAQDGISTAKKFNRKLQLSLQGISMFPYKSRRSFYYDNEYTRDYVFKGYTIPYLIDDENKKIMAMSPLKVGKSSAFSRQGLKGELQRGFSLYQVVSSKQDNFLSSQP